VAPRLLIATTVRAIITAITVTMHLFERRSDVRRGRNSHLALHCSPALCNNPVTHVQLYSITTNQAAKAANNCHAAGSILKQLLIFEHKYRPIALSCMEMTLQS
jgi:hypothetical protein